MISDLFVSDGPINSKEIQKACCADVTFLRSFFDINSISISSILYPFVSGTKIYENMKVIHVIPA